ncbi:MAG: hypothetical protein F4Y45_13695 [Acidobacteria bacterium]|nr:hypothetical protein [Acidobacteriota bacterium]MXZ71255.1 hypothetical protein [Acidobacteriota bacterium]MYD72340.1 hypothetical protein [Acidobacteriota bacterium]MYJ06111.1 hypothetical protein [Acidobacteriota bacterium]
MKARWRGAGAIALFLAGVAAVPAAAQEPAVQPVTGGLEIEKIRSGFVVAPDYKFTEVDGISAGLLGVRGGLVTDRRLFIGGAGYWLPGTRDGLEMWYGGGLVEWFANPDGLVDFSVSGLLGAGTATLTDGVALFGGTAFPFDGRGAHHVRHGWWPGWGGGHDDGWFGIPWFGRRHYRQEFFVAEPQATVHLNLKDWLRVGGGAGYRFIGAAGEANGRLSGFTASIGVQFGPP